MTAVRDDILPESLTEPEDPVVTNIVDRVYQMVQNTLGANAISSERVRQPRAAQDIDGFYTLVNEAIDDKQAQEKIQPDLRLVYTEEDPPVDMNTEMITYGLAKRMPATYGGPAWQGSLGSPPLGSLRRAYHKLKPQQ